MMNESVRFLLTQRELSKQEHFATMSSTGVSTEGGGTVITTDIQDILIILSAAISFIKSILSVGIYSYWHVPFAIAEVVLSAFAFAIFVTDDIDDTHIEGTGEEYGNSMLLYNLTFISAVMAEVLDVIVTYHTVHTFKKIKSNLSDNADDRAEFKAMKKQAKCQYICNYIMASVLSSIVPLIAFSKANWEIDYFGPFPFSPANGKLLFVATIMFMTYNGLYLMFSVFSLCNEYMMCSTMCACACLNFFIVSPPAGVLIYIVLFKVEGAEAGGLTYLTMITAFQCCELAAEGGRFMRWVQYEAKKEMDARDGKTEERDVEQASEGDNGSVSDDEKGLDLDL